MSEYFITGIDTDIGKTFVTRGLALAYENSGKKVGVYKPMQSGAIKTESGFVAPDLEAVKSLSSTVALKCSYLLEGEVSPALAARLAGIKPDTDKIKTDYINFSKENDVTLIEGAGGILAPVTDDLLCADLIKILNIPIIIVTVPFLGRLNHTLLTVKYAQREGINIKGIIINKYPTENRDCACENFVNELKMYTDVPVSGIIPDIKNPDKDILIKEFKNII